MTGVAAVPTKPGMLSLSGRIGRHDFARFAALSWIALNAIALVGAVPMHTVDSTYPLDHVPSFLRTLVLPHGVSVVLIGLGMAAMLAIALVLLSLNVRRFHDLNLSGWFVLLWIVITSVIPKIVLGDYLPTLNDLIWYAALVTIPGTKGANRYGLPHTPGETPGRLPAEAEDATPREPPRSPVPGSAAQPRPDA